MHIGLIGGIGPSATVAYYLRLVEVFGKAGVPLHLTVQHSDIAVLTENAGRMDVEAQSAHFLAHIEALRAAGCDLVGITALTGHFCVPRLREVSPLPILSATSAIDAYCSEHGIGRLGLLGGPSVLGTHLFGMLDACETIVPDRDIEAVGRTYMQIATSAACTPAQAAMLIGAGEAMIRDQKADAILLAGTDLGLAFDGADPGYCVIDALHLHVEAFLSEAQAG